MKNIVEILKEAIIKNIITTKEFNIGISVFVVYRIVWETKSHYILYVLPTEEQAKEALKDKPENEYFYQELRVPA